MPSISVVEEASQLLGERARRHDPVEDHDQQRGDRAHHRQAHGGRQPEHTVIEVAEGGSQHDKDGGGVKRCQVMHAVCLARAVVIA
jgi:hypothetical protein